jgi:cell division protein FtsN
MQKNVISAQSKSAESGSLCSVVAVAECYQSAGSANFVEGIKRCPKHMRGGTLAGVVLGLLVGLIVALGVALYVTKAPMPFIHQDANKDASAAGKAGGVVSKQMMSMPGLPNGSVSVGGGSQLPPDPNVVLLPKEAREFLAGSNASGKTGGLDAEKSQTSTPVVFFLETGKFRENEEAEQMRVRLMLVGVEANVVEVIGDSAAPHRVRVGPFNSAEEAYRARARVTENGFEAKLVKLGNS